jgi:hypothetical protein
MLPGVHNKYTELILKDEADMYMGGWEIKPGMSVTEAREADGYSDPWE